VSFFYLPFVPGAYHNAEPLSSPVRGLMKRRKFASFSAKFPPIRAAKTVLVGFSMGTRVFRR
jgi:hypothetical protein